MKLTNEDKKYLLSIGTPSEDVPQIEYATKKTRYLKCGDKKNGDKRISMTAAIRILGRETWLNGLSRSAFHFTAIRENRSNAVLFDSSAIFK